MNEQPGPAPFAGADEVEVLLLLPACQMTALEELAARVGVSVPELLGRAIASFLRPPL